VEYGGWAVETDRPPQRHLARTVPLGLHPGPKAGSIAATRFEQGEGVGYVDVDAGAFNRLAGGPRRTKKSQPAIRLPPRVVAHIARWRRLGISRTHVVEWRGRPIAGVDKAFRAACDAVGLDRDVPPTRCATRRRLG
jgi:hypothetical protein